MALLTKILIGAVSLILIGWDIVVAANNAPGDTISELMRNAGRNALGLPFAYGALMGHFWGPSLDTRLNLAGSLGILIGCALLLSGLRFFTIFPAWAGLIAGAAGIVCGLLAWPQ